MPDALYYETIRLPRGEFPIRLLVSQHDSDDMGCEFHWHELLEFYYVLSGGVLLGCRGRQFWLQAGDVGFVNWCEPHRGLKFKDQSKHYIIQMDLKLLEAETQLSENRSYASLLLERLQNVPVCIRQDRQLGGLFDRLIQEYERQEIGYELTVKACLYEILAKLLRIPEVPSPQKAYQGCDRRSLSHVREILLYLASNYPQTQKTELPALASRFGLSVSYLCRIFKAHTGHTVRAYTNELRCSRAASLIQNGVSLSQVCEQVGIADYNYFSRLFKRHMGCAPSEYKPRCMQSTPSPQSFR